MKGEKTGYAYSENTDMPDMTSAAKAAAAIASGSSSCRTYAPVTDVRHDFYPVKQDWRHTKASTFLPFLLDLEKAITSRDSRIVKVIARLSNSVTDVMMFNSLGELTYDTRPMGSISVTAIFQKDGRSENKSASRSFRTGAELIGPAMIEELADEVVKGIVSLLSGSVIGRALAGRALRSRISKSTQMLVARPISLPLSSWKR